MKKRMKIILNAVGIVIILLLVSATAVFAYTYSVDIQVSETGSNTYAYLPYITDIDNEYLADNGYMVSTGLGTRVTSGGVELEHLVADDKLLFVIPSLAANSSNTYSYKFGEDVLSSFPIITGYGGYVTVSDDGDLELGNDFEIEVSGYIDTSSGADKNIVNKAGAFKIYVSAEDSITAAMLDLDHSTTWASPTSAGGFSNSENTYDESTGTYAEYDIPAGSYSGWITMSRASVASGKVRYYINRESTYVSSIQIEVYYSGGWHSLTPTDTWGSWAEVDIGSFEGVTSAKMRFYNAYASPYYVRVHEFDFNEAEEDEVVSVVATGISSGEHTVKVTADGTNLKIYVDDVEEDSITSGMSVTNNGNNWLLMQTNVMPYAGYYKHTVADTLIAWYQPIDIIATTVLPDRQGDAENGAITWGTNPEDISDSIGSLVSENQPSVTPGTSPDTIDVLPPIDQPGWFETSDLSSNPFHPIVEALADMSGFSEWQVWLGAASVLILGVMATIYFRFRNQLLAGGLGTMLAAFCVGIGIYPWWILIIFGFMLVAAIVFERKPVV